MRGDMGGGGVVHTFGERGVHRGFMKGVHMGFTKRGVHRGFTQRGVHVNPTNPPGYGPVRTHMNMLYSMPVTVAESILLKPSNITLDTGSMYANSMGANECLYHSLNGNPCTS